MNCEKCGNTLTQEGKCENCGEFVRYTPGMPLPAAPTEVIPTDPPAVAVVRSLFTSTWFLALCIVQTICTVFSVFGGVPVQIMDASLEININIGFLPMVIVTVGLWKIYSSCKRLPAGERLPTGGITVTKAGTLIGTIVSAVTTLSSGAILIAQMTIMDLPSESLYSGQEFYSSEFDYLSSEIYVVLVVLTLIVGVSMAVSSVFFASTFKSLSDICITGRYLKKIPLFTVIISFVAGAANLLLALFAGAGFFVPMSFGILGVLLGLLLDMARKKLNSILRY